MNTTPVPDKTVTNGDELLDFGGARYIGNFHKTLPRLNNGNAAANASGEVDPKSYIAFARICDEDLDCEFIPATANATQLVNPQAGRAAEQLGPDPQNMHMIPAPSVLSDSTAAEMVELYWMAKLRDLPLNAFAGDADVADAITDIGAAYQRALTSTTRTTGDLRLGLDLPQAAGGALDIRLQTLFRCGLRDEDKGPLISQFLLHDINYGAQLIQQTQVPYKDSRNYLVTFADWLARQSTGKDGDGNGYGNCNNFHAPAGAGYYENARRRIATMRDMARFVNRDALHQAYFNAALMLDGWGATLDSGNPYAGLYRRQAGFGTLGGPNLLALVSEVATRALKVVWRQKWLHRRLRPEAYGGLLHVQQIGSGGANSRRAYGLPTWSVSAPMRITPHAAASQLLLPMAFTAGSPAHPAYGAGHATVAGACVTILKAWFDEDQLMQPLLLGADGTGRDPSTDFPTQPPATLAIWEPGTKTAGPLPVYAGPDDALMTVGGELNKLASNVAMGRSMGGVHWRSDNTRSLRLGEQVATIMLKRILPTYAERPLSLSYRNFDGNPVHIASTGSVSVAGDPALESFYNTRAF